MGAGDRHAGLGGILTSSWVAFVGQGGLLASGASGCTELLRLDGEPRQRGAVTLDVFRTPIGSSRKQNDMMALQTIDFVALLARGAALDATVAGGR